LDADSCVDAICRFIARRGKPKFIRSDNGTNLVGAEKRNYEKLSFSFAAVRNRLDV
jgi:hypothetical protein